MAIKNISIGFVLMVICISCNQNKTKYETIEYYDTGEVFKIEERISEHDVYARFYFKNGTIRQEGVISDSLKSGSWKLYYSDGVLRGDVIFFEDKIINEVVRQPISLNFKGDSTQFKIGNSYQFRVLGVYLHKVKIPGKTFGYPQKLDESVEPYSFEITPQKAGIDTIMVTINHFNEQIPNDTLFFPITIIE